MWARTGVLGRAGVVLEGTSGRRMRAPFVQTGLLLGITCRLVWPFPAFDQSQDGRPGQIHACYSHVNCRHFQVCGFRLSVHKIASRVSRFIVNINIVLLLKIANNCVTLKRRVPNDFYKTFS